MEGDGEKHVKRQKGDFEVEITLKQEEEGDAVLIGLTDVHRCSRFHLRISGEELEAQGPLFTSNIESVKDFYEYIVNEFNDLVFTDEGAMIVQIEVTIKRKHEVRSYRFEGEKQEVNPYEMLVLQIQQLKNKFEEDSQKKDKRIAKLQENSSHLQELKEELQEKINSMSTQKENDASKASFQMLSINEKLERIQRNLAFVHQIKVQTYAMIEEDRREVEEKLEEIRKKIANSIENVTNISAIVIDQSRAIKSMKTAVEEIDSRRREKWNQIRMHPENPSKNYFRVEEIFDAISVKRLGGEAWQNYIGSQELGIGKVHFFQMKQVKTLNRGVIFGIGSKNAFGSIDAYHHKEILCLSSYSGNVFELSNRRLCEQTVSDGSIVSMRVDLSNFIIWWFIDGKEAATAIISPSLRSTPLYLFLMMRIAGDEVHLLL